MINCQGSVSANLRRGVIGFSQGHGVKWRVFLHAENAGGDGVGRAEVVKVLFCGGTVSIGMVDLGVLLWGRWWSGARWGC